MTDEPPHDNQNKAHKARRYHHKTRMGCAPCKAQRIKCDEERPICANCSRKSICCSFYFLTPNVTASLRKDPCESRHRLNSDLARHRPEQQGLTIPQPPSIISSVQILGQGLFEGPSSDWELIYHFQHHTAFNVVDNASITKMFSTYIPSIAAEHSFLCHGLLAIASCDLARLNSNRTAAAKYIALGARHMNIGIPIYAQIVQTCTRENINALFSYALLIVLYTFVTAHEEFEELFSSLSSFLDPHPQLIRKFSTIPVRICDGIRGIFDVFWTYQRWIASSPLFPAVQRYNKQRPSEKQMRWARLEDEQLANLERLWLGNDHPSADNRSTDSDPDRWQRALSGALTSLRTTMMISTQLIILPEGVQDSGHKEEGYNVTVDDLCEIHRQISASRLDDIPSTFTWYVTLTPDFCQLLQQGNCYAMVLLAHYAIVMDRTCFRQWWVGRLPVHFVATARLVLGQKKEKWIEWPLRVVRGAMGLV